MKASHRRTRLKCAATGGKDTEAVCRGDGQHPPGVVPVRIHAEEELEPEDKRGLTAEHEAFV